MLEYQTRFQVSCFPCNRHSFQSAAKSEESPGKVGFSLPVQLASSCRQLAQRHNTIESKVLAAGLKALFLRYEGRTGEAPQWTLLRLLEDTDSPANADRTGFAIGVEAGADIRADLVLSLRIQPEGRIAGAWRYRRDLF